MSAKETIGDFEVEVSVKNRWIKAVHQEYGHEYLYSWYTEPPHLRLPNYRSNQLAERGADGFVMDAETAMRRKLRKDKLIP
jgi:hypothetical protein